MTSYAYDVYDFTTFHESLFSASVELVSLCFLYVRRLHKRGRLLLIRSRLGQ